MEAQHLTSQSIPQGIQTGKRYCEDCRFCVVPTAGIGFAGCSHPNNPPTTCADRFVARQFDKPLYASTVRMRRELCGEDANWFEPKPADQVAA